MSNPNRGRGGQAARPFIGPSTSRPALTAGRTSQGEASASISQLVVDAHDQPPSHDHGAPNRGGVIHHHHPHQHPRGGFRGRVFVHDRGRGRGYRGRGRGVVNGPPVESS